MIRLLFSTYVFSALSLLGALTGRGLAAEPLAAEPLKVVATTSIIADAVRNIGGGDVSVTALMGPGVDPHTYVQTRTDVAAMLRADVTFHNGLRLEAQMETFLNRLAQRRKVVAVTEEIPKNLLLSDAIHLKHFDPHVWMSPHLWRRVIPVIRKTLTAARPDRAVAFAKRTAAYVKKIQGLENYATRIFSELDSKRKLLLTGHDAFRYLSRDYDVEVVGIQGISTASEIGVQRITDLIELIVSRELPYVFVESSVSNRNARALIEGAQARGFHVEIGGTLYSDAMGKPGTYEGTYVGMMDHNITLIAASMGGAVPPRGMSGLLSKSLKDL